MDSQTGSYQWIYRITVQGRLDEDWSGWFHGLAIECKAAGEWAVTSLTGPVVDQAALRGILNKLWDLNLTLVSVARLEKEIPSVTETNYVTSIHSLTE